MSLEWQRGEYTITTDAARLDVGIIHDFLNQESYWGRGRSRALVERSIANSLAFGVYKNSQQVGFARVITDYATFAYLADVFVVPAERGQGVSKWLLQSIALHPALQGLQRWLLATRDAHGLYQQYGFTPLTQPDHWLERFTEPSAATS